MAKIRSPLEVLGITTHRGYTGAFTRQQAGKALYPNGARVAKSAEDAGGDLTPLGTVGTVLGSIYDPGQGVAYFIEWDGKPKTAVFCVEWKLAAVSPVSNK